MYLRSGEINRELNETLYFGIRSPDIVLGWESKHSAYFTEKTKKTQAPGRQGKDLGLHMFSLSHVTPTASYPHIVHSPIKFQLKKIYQVYCGSVSSIFSSLV